MSAAEQVKMQMIHRLPTIVPCIDNDSIAPIQLLFTSNLRCCSH